MILVRCRCCHRAERRGPDGVTVDLPGGARRPEPPVEVAAARRLAEIARAGEVVVGPCAGCGMPASAAPPAPEAPWSIPLDGGRAVVFAGGAFACDGRPVTPEAAIALVEARYPPPPGESRGVRALQLAMLSAMAAPILFWAFLCGFWFNYIANFGSTPWRP